MCFIICSSRVRLESHFKAVLASFRFQVVLIVSGFLRLRSYVKPVKRFSLASHLPSSAWKTRKTNQQAMIMDKPIKAYTLNLARRRLFQEKSPCVIRCAARINTWSTLVPQICMIIFLTWHCSLCWRHERSIKSMEDGACLQRDLDHILTSGVISGKWI